MYEMMEIFQPRAFHISNLLRHLMDPYLGQTNLRVVWGWKPWNTRETLSSMYQLPSSAFFSWEQKILKKNLNKIEMEQRRTRRQNNPHPLICTLSVSLPLPSSFSSTKLKKHTKKKERELDDKESWRDEWSSSFLLSFSFPSFLFPSLFHCMIVRPIICFKFSCLVMKTSFVPCCSYYTWRIFSGAHIIIIWTVENEYYPPYWYTSNFISIGAGPTVRLSAWWKCD